MKCECGGELVYKDYYEDWFECLQCGIMYGVKALFERCEKAEARAEVWLAMCEDCKHMRGYNNDIDRTMTCIDKRNINGLCTLRDCPLMNKLDSVDKGGE